MKLSKTDHIILDSYCKMLDGLLDYLSSLENLDHSVIKTHNMLWGHFSAFLTIHHYGISSTLQKKCCLL